MPGTPSAARNVIEARNLLKRFLATFEPDTYSGRDAERLVDLFAEVERLGSSGLGLAALRVEATNVHKSNGHRSANTYLSQKTGESASRAAEILETARTVKANPVIDQAVRKGKLSEAQVKAVTSAVKVHPEQAAILIDAAAKTDLAEFKKRCADVRNQTYSEEESLARYERLRKSRYLKTWTDTDGMGRLDARLTPDALDLVRSGLAPFEKLFFDQARKDDRKEHPNAYSSDALVAMAEASLTGGSRRASSFFGGPVSGDSADSPDSDRLVSDSPDSDGPRSDSPNSDHPNFVSTPKSSRQKPPQYLIRIRADADSLDRGFTLPGEVSEVMGGGSVPPTIVRSLIKDAVLEVVATKGTEVHSICTDSRYISKILNIALEERDQVCCVEGCNATYPLERDHYKVDFSKNGRTSLDNLLRVCRWHHHLKTNEGWYWEGTPGQTRKMRLINPNDPSEPEPPHLSESDESPPPTNNGTGGKSPPGQTKLL